MGSLFRIILIAFACVVFTPAITAQVTMRLENIDPRNAEPGARVTIRGSGFGASRGSKVLIIYQGRLTTLRSWRMGVSSWSDTEIHGSVPRIVPAGDYQVAIALDDSPLAAMSNALSLHIVEPLSEFFSTEPAQGPGETVITIHGRNLGREPGRRVIGLSGLGFNEMEVRSWSETEIRTVVPADLTPGDYEIYFYPERGGASSVRLGFFKVTVLAMSLNSVFPTEGLPGYSVRLRGHNFGRRDRKIISINHAGQKERLEVASWLDSEINATLPSDLTPGEYRILIYQDDSYRSSSDSLAFRVNEFPVISSVTPSAAKAGTEILVRGRNFGREVGEQVLALSRGSSGLPSLFIVSWSDTEIRARVPNVRPGRYAVAIYFTNRFRNSSNSVEFNLTK